MLGICHALAVAGRREDNDKDVKGLKRVIPHLLKGAGGKEKARDEESCNGCDGFYR